jgi:hypothetical protein
MAQQRQLVERWLLNQEIQAALRKVYGEENAPPPEHVGQTSGLPVGGPPGPTSSFPSFAGCTGSTCTRSCRRLTTRAAWLALGRRARVGKAKRGHTKYTTYRGKLWSRDTMNSAFPDVLGVPALSSQRLGSSMGFGPAMRKVPRKTRKRVKPGGKPNRGAIRRARTATREKRASAGQPRSGQGLTLSSDF